VSDRMPERATLLNTAGECVLKERNASYGEPDQDFTRIAAIWSILFGREFTAAEVAQALIALKLSRLVHSPGHFDSWVDIAGYAACGWECSYLKEKRDGSKSSQG
jgi:hypothetical protein